MDDKFQFQSCNNFCDKEIGPICRETRDKNLHWPSSKAGQIIKLECKKPYDSKQSRKFAYKKCNFNQQKTQKNPEYSLLTKFKKSELILKSKTSLLNFRNNLNETDYTEFEEPNYRKVFIYLFILERLNQKSTNHYVINY